jgi:hypothetical protein
VSYDLQVWTARAFEAEPAALTDSGWKANGAGWSRNGKGWLVNVFANHEVLTEDIPEAVRAALPGIRFLTELSLEPGHAPKTAMSLLRSTAQTIAKVAHGVVFDPQDETVALPSGVKRFAPEPRGERLALLSFSWWFTHDDLLRRDGIERLVWTLESEIPEALPRRYGLYEPPQFDFEKMGRAHFVEFLAEHSQQLVVWYAHRPVVGVHRSIRSPSGWQPLGQNLQYRCQYLSLDVEHAALQQPGWPFALRRLWRRVSRDLQPFYGEVRTLHGYVRSGARVQRGRETEENPTKSWWWKGVPPSVGQAFVIGPPYVDLWPLDSATEDGPLRFVETADWTQCEEASALVGGVPVVFASRERTVAAELAWPAPVYPPTFPFPHNDPR